MSMLEIALCFGAFLICLTWAALKIIGGWMSSAHQGHDFRAKAALEQSKDQHDEMMAVLVGIQVAVEEMAVWSPAARDAYALEQVERR